MRQRLVIPTSILALCCAVLLAGACGEAPGGRDGGAASDKQVNTDRGGDDGLACADPKTYYLDEDGDGWGSTDALQACSQPAGYVTISGDCADGDSNAFPGQTAFFTEPIKGQTANEWDYNCDGVAERKELYQDAIICANRGYTVCDTSFAPSWWGTKPPECGETRKIVVSCAVNGSELNFTCDPSFAGEATQPCR